VKKIYLLAGVPASGKTWICEQLKDSFDHIAHDDYIGKDHDARYVAAIKRMRDLATKPILIETPFSVSSLLDPLRMDQCDVEVIFLITDETELTQRYFERNQMPYPKGNITRQNTYRERAHEWNCFSGTSSEVLEYLKTKGA
jgi:broad-specificity NMP kinase